MAAQHSENGRRGLLAVASEAGSSKALVPVLACLAGRGIGVRGFLSPSVCEVLRHWPAVADAGSVAPILADQSLQATLGSSQPAAVLLGTTAVPSVERELIVYAREHGIRTVAVVDERYAYRRRFSDDDGNLCRLPDAIALMDEECYQDALAEGLPADRLHVTGSPILSYLVDHSATIGGSIPPTHPESR